MDLVATCKDKLAYFRIKELKEVLTQLGLPKQGRKQDLVLRILAVLSDELAAKLQRNSIGKEDVAKIIDDIHRKMQNTARDLASAGDSGSDINNVKQKEDLDDSFQMDMKVRCPCGNSLPTESMIQCEDTRCRVWQHINCVMIPEKPMEGVPTVPPQYHCEICRLARADPFWVSVAHPLPPVKLATSNIPTDGTNPVQSIDKAFQLTRADRDLLQKNEYDVQAWCILLNDKVPFRMQWPQFADLQINGVPIRTTNRPGSQLLGAHGRDDGPAITTCTREGINKIFLSACDARIFCLGVRIARRRTVQQILNLIPKEVDGEAFEDAVARVRRCVGGGNATDNADSDSDLEVVADSITVNLRCPLSGSRMKTAGRFKPCLHMGCFDLDTFVELNQRSRKWQCPICLKNYALENVIIDPYFNRITGMMRGCGEDITDIDVKPDGSWRVKNENERRELAQWHFADGFLCIVSTERDLTPNLETLKQVKQEGGSDGHSGLKIGIKKNHMGVWQVSKPDCLQSLSSENRFEEKHVTQCQRIVPMSSSATGSCRDGEDPSVNQGGAELFDFSANNGNELDSISLNFDSPYGVNRTSSAPAVNADIIVLSDSEDENGNLVSPDIVYGTGQVDAGDIPFPVPPTGAQGVYPEDPGVSTSGGIGIFPSNGNDIDINLWSSLATDGEPAFQLFNSEANGPDNVVDVQRPSVNGYAMGVNTTESVHQASYTGCLSGNGVNGALMDNPLALRGDDPSLQIFLPSRAAAVCLQTDSREQQDVSNGIRNEDWISLRLGGGNSGDCGSTCANGLNSKKQPSKEGRMETLADTASLLLSMSDGRSEKATSNKHRLGGPFSHPRQPRSVRPRLYLSIDSDSE